MKNKFFLYLKLARLHSLTGAWLLLLPSFWGLALNYNHNISLGYYIYLYGAFFLGAICMRSFGCVINDMADINFDKEVLRTQNRPLASGELTRKDAYILLSITAIIPIIILLTFPLKAQLVALASLFFVVLYPFTKRFFKAPQLILGITFNWGIILSSVLLNDNIPSNVWLLYAIAILWTVAYDSVYAYQDYDYDKKIGINSTAILIGDNPQKILLVMYVIILLGLILLSNLSNLNIYYVVIVVGSGIYLLYKLMKLDHKNSQACFDFFKANVHFAILIWIGLLLGK